MGRATPAPLPTGEGGARRRRRWEGEGWLGRGDLPFLLPRRKKASTGSARTVFHFNEAQSPTTPLATPAAPAYSAPIATEIPLPQPSPVPRLLERLRAKAAPRTLALILALAIEALLLFLLYSFGVQPPRKPEDRITIVSLTPDAAPEAKPEPPRPQPKQAQQRPAPQPETQQVPPPVPVEPTPQPPTPVPPTPIPTPPVALKPTLRAAPPRLYGPPDTGSPPGSSFADSELVGTAPNGEPLYAAEWYRKMDRRALGAYMSTAQGPGWGLIACKTAPEYRVEDCVALGESPRGSQIARAVLAAAWEFRVRPPRLGGKSLVGAWVRIQIDYEITR